MSENLDLVRSIYAAWGRGEFGFVDWAHPEIEWVMADGPAPASWTGVAGMAEGFQDWLSAWGDLRFFADEYRELDNERVLVLANQGGRGKTSGLELGQPQTKGAHVFHVQSGKVTRLVIYADPTRALADLGLAE